MSVADCAKAVADALGAGYLGSTGEGDELCLWARPERIREALAALKGAGFNVFIDLSALDLRAWGSANPLKPGSGAPPAPAGAVPAARFEVVWRLMGLDAAEGLIAGRVALKTRLAEGQSLPSAAALWPAADWPERELWDMFGIPFSDRPGIKRILMYEEFSGHPLRKDYPIAKRQPLIGPASGEPADNPSFNHEYPTVTAD